MGINTNYYVIYGYSIPWTNYSEIAKNSGDDENIVFSAFEKYMDSPYKLAKRGDFLILDDGMNGDYRLIGICLAVSKEYDGFNGPVPCVVTQKEKNLLKEKINVLSKELFKYYSIPNLLRNQKPNFYVVTHVR